MPSDKQERPIEVERALAGRLEAVGWGCFFIWVGVALLADLSWWVGLLGVGVIALGGQAARKYFGLKVEGFGLVVGIIFVAWSLWELLKIQFGGVLLPGGLLPIGAIVVGIVLVVRALLRRPSQ